MLLSYKHLLHCGCEITGLIDECRIICVTINSYRHFGVHVDSCMRFPRSARSLPSHAVCMGDIIKKNALLENPICPNPICFFLMVSTFGCPPFAEPCSAGFLQDSSGLCGSRRHAPTTPLRVATSRSLPNESSSAPFSSSSLLTSCAFVTLPVLTSKSRTRVAPPFRQASACRRVAPSEGHSR